MPILEIVAGDTQQRSWVSKTKLTLEPDWILSLLGLLEDGCHLTVGCWVNVPLTCDLRGDLGWLLDHLAGTEGEHAICALLSVKVNVAQELLRR